MVRRRRTLAVETVEDTLPPPPPGHNLRPDAAVWAAAEKAAAETGRPAAEFVYDALLVDTDYHGKISDWFRGADRWSEYVAIWHYRCGTREPATDKEKADVARWGEIASEAFLHQRRALTPAERKLRERLRKAGLEESQQHRKEREALEEGPDTGRLPVRGLLFAAAVNSGGDDAAIKKAQSVIGDTVTFDTDDFEVKDRELSKRQFYRLAQKVNRAINVQNDPALAARYAAVDRFNGLARKFIAFRNAWRNAPAQDHRTLVRNFPNAAAELEEILDQMADLQLETVR